MNGRDFSPCGVSYHPSCVRVGAPFSTRRREGQGLTFPACDSWGTFVCESCTVRSVLKRELHQPEDASLLALERIRIIDMAHSWSRNTHASYRSKIRTIEAFQSKYQVCILPARPLLRPRNTPDIGLMWCQEAHSLEAGVARDQERLTMAFGTIRQLRAAVSQRLTWECTQQPHLHTYLDHHKRLLHDAGRYTDELPSQLHAQGMAIRLGTESSPSKALLDRHVRELDGSLDRAYQATNVRHEQRELALAGLANLVLWLGWLRAGEALSLRWSDIAITSPPDSPTVGLPPGIGVVSLRLLPETKTSRTATADIILAYTTSSGYSIGRWVMRARDMCGQHLWNTPTLVFTSPQGVQWTSLYFRQTYLYPSLLSGQQNGDPYLRPLTSIPAAFWSLHCYRRGARSHVSRRRQVGTIWTRKATPMEVYEHARWQRRRQGEPIDLAYQQWDLYDRIQLTLFCM